MRAALFALACGLALGACKKRATSELDAAPPAVAEIPAGEGGWFEDEDSSFRIYLPATPILSEEAQARQGVPLISHMAQIKRDESEILVMWSDLPQQPRDAQQVDKLLTEVVQGWVKAGLKVREINEAQMSACTGRQLRGLVDRVEVDARVLICDESLVQLVTSGVFVPDAMSVFETFEWLGPA